FPDLAKDQIIVSYGGDLWLVARSGGVARRITTHPGLELFPKFSPDGKWICFTGQYDGNFNVYAMPSEGGDPKQLTVHPGGGALSERMGIHNEVINWLPDSKHILYLSRRNTFNDWFGQKDTECDGKDRKSTRLNSSHLGISYAVFWLKKKYQSIY